MTFSTALWFSKNLATANPFSICLSMRTCSVFNPLFTRKQSKGDGTVPRAREVEKRKVYYDN